jgi:putative DNA primase/helicase
MALKRASNIAPEVLNWLWQDRIPFGKLTLFAGHPGVGKGMATMYVSACASKGCGWHDVKNTNPPVEVVIISSEDAAADTLVPRLMAAGADKDKVMLLQSVVTDKGPKDFTLDTDLNVLRSFLEFNPDVKVIIIDPVMNHLGHLKGNSEQEVRMALSPLAKIAEKFGVAIILVTHYNKSQGADSIQRVGGAMGMVGAVRVAWSFGENKLTGKMEMTPLKANIAPNTGGLEYQIVSEEVEINGQFISVGKIKFGDVTHASADAALKTPDKEAFVPLYKQCMDWLVEHLTDGELHPKVDVYKSAEAMGFGNADMSMARQKLGNTVKYIQSKDVWYLQIEPKHEESE